MDQRLGEAEPLPVALRQHAGLLVPMKCEAKPVYDPVHGLGIGQPAHPSRGRRRYRQLERKARRARELGILLVDVATLLQMLKEL